MWEIDGEDFSFCQYVGQGPLNDPFAVKQLEVMHLKISVF